MWITGAADPTYKVANQAKPHFIKTPKHMSIILALDYDIDENWLEDLSRIITWAMMFDIECLSVYDCL
eukprot:Ihof_evm4s358 gene=Ihof_evmTU4s358